MSLVKARLTQRASHLLYSPFSWRVGRIFPLSRVWGVLHTPALVIRDEWNGQKLLLLSCGLGSLVEGGRSCHLAVLRASRFAVLGLCEVQLCS